MALERREIKQALRRKGFDEKETKHHTYLVYELHDKKLAGRQTRMSRGSKHKTIGDNLISEMARQLGLTRKQFLDLVNCPLSREEYEAIITAQ